MPDEPKQMKSIWYLVGLMLLVMGAVIAVAGVLEYFHPPETPTILAELHPGIWWGLLMVGAGAIFYFSSRRSGS